MEEETQLQIIHNEIANLPDIFSFICTEFYINHKKIKDIAYEHNINLSTVKNRIRWGKKIIIDNVTAKYKM